MITRLWRGWTRAEDADAYRHFLLDELFPSMRAIDGFRSADVLTRADGEEVAFITLTRFDSLGAIKNEEDPKKRLQKLVNAPDVAGKFAWAVLARTLIYSARRLGEIADDISSIDQAMRWGFNWDLGQVPRNTRPRSRGAFLRDGTPALRSRLVARRTINVAE